MAAIIAIGVLLVVLEANPANDIVNAVLDAARWLVGPFEDFFSLDDPKLEVARRLGRSRWSSTCWPPTAAGRTAPRGEPPAAIAASG